LHLVILLPEEYSFTRNFECTPTKIWWCRRNDQWLC